MAGFILLGMLAAFGALSGLWALFGWIMPCEAGGIMVCRCFPGMKESFFIKRYVFLREMGLLNCPLLVVDDGLSPEEQKWLLSKSGIEICSPEEIASRLEVERNQIE